MDFDLIKLSQLFQPLKPQAVKPGSGSYIPNIVFFVIQMLLFVAALAVIFAILYGGLMYITSAGDETKASKGRAAVLNGVIGAIVVSLSFVVVQLIRQIVTQ